MFGLLRIIIWGLIVYVVYKVAVSVMKIFMENKRSEMEGDKVKQNKYKIDKEDIIDAKFEDISAGEKDNSNDRK